MSIWKSWRREKSLVQRLYSVGYDTMKMDKGKRFFSSHQRVDLLWEPTQPQMCTGRYFPGLKVVEV
jgi:hypothetical protein